MKLLWVTLPYPPSANRYWRRHGTYMHKSNEARDYQAKTAIIARAKGMQLISGDVQVCLNVYRPAKRGDLDNFSKVLLDALRGVAYADDNQIVQINARRFDDKNNPRVEVLVQEIHADDSRSQSPCFGKREKRNGVR